MRDQSLTKWLGTGQSIELNFFKVAQSDFGTTILFNFERLEHRSYQKIERYWRSRDGWKFKTEYVLPWSELPWQRYECRTHSFTFSLRDN